MKKVMTAAGLLLLLAGFSLVGCSTDRQRVTLVGADTNPGNLATGTDDEGSYDWNDYASDGYYYPDNDVVPDTWDPNGHDYDDDPEWPEKPQDNGLGYN